MTLLNFCLPGSLREEPGTEVGCPAKAFKVSFIQNRRCEWRIWEWEEIIFDLSAEFCAYIRASTQVTRSWISLSILFPLKCQFKDLNTFKDVSPKSAPLNHLRFLCFRSELVKPSTYVTKSYVAIK